MFPYPRDPSPMLDQATPYGVVSPDNVSALEQLQEEHEAAMSRDRTRRAVSRAERRYIGEQPKRLVTLDKVRGPGAPVLDLFDTFHDLPRQWVGSCATRELVRRA